MKHGKIDWYHAAGMALCTISAGLVVLTFILLLTGCGDIKVDGPGVNGGDSEQNTEYPIKRDGQKPPPRKTGIDTIRQAARIGIWVGIAGIPIGGAIAAFGAAIPFIGPLVGAKALPLGVRIVCIGIGIAFLCAFVDQIAEVGLWVIGSLVVLGGLLDAYYNLYLPWQKKRRRL